MKNLFTIAIICVLSSSAFALNCKGVKPGSYDLVQLVQLSDRNYPHVTAIIGHYSMQAILVGDTLSMLIYDQDEKKTSSRTAVNGITNKRGLSVFNVLLTPEGEYKLNCEF